MKLIVLPTKNKYNFQNVRLNIFVTHHLLSLNAIIIIYFKQFIIVSKRYLKLYQVSECGWKQNVISRSKYL